MYEYLSSRVGEMVYLTTTCDTTLVGYVASVDKNTATLQHVDTASRGACVRLDHIRTAV